MKLIKDLIEGRIVFYWLSDEDGQLGPHLHTLQDAEEWWKTYMFAQYAGVERRRSIHDRRLNHEKRRKRELTVRFNQSNPNGRRVTDRAVRVDIDLVQEKILQLTQ